MTTQTIQATPTFGWDTRTAKKPYACRSCGGMIQTGEVHLVRPHRTDDRRLETWREHRACPIPPTPGRRPKPVQTRDARRLITNATLGTVCLAIFVAIVIFFFTHS